MKMTWLFLIALALAACGPAIETPVAVTATRRVVTATPRPTDRPSATAVVPETAACATGRRETAQVLDVVDGDTIEVLIGGDVFSVRYIGIDTPETGMPLADEATTWNASLVDHQIVTLISDVSDVDRYGRLLRYVVADGIFVNFDLVLEGLASAEDYPPDSACAESLANGQTTATLLGFGMWEVAPTPMPTRRPTLPPPPLVFPTSPPAQSNCHPSYPTVCIPPPPPDLDCGDIPYRRFSVTGSDPHGFDGDDDGIGCESG